MKKLTLALFVLSATFHATVAQTTNFEGIMKVNMQNFGSIMENNVLTGYYGYYQYDKVNSKENAYYLKLMDDNLNVVKTIDMVRPKKSILLESVFNGQNFMFMFITKNDVELITYDKTGKKTGSKLISDISKWEKARLGSAVDEGEQNVSVYSVGDSGFVRQTWLKNDKLGYAFEAYNNQCKQLWTFGSDPNSKEIETADIIYSSANYVVAGVGKKKHMLSNEATMYVLAVNATNGKKLFEKALGDKANEMSYLNAFVDEDKNSVIVVGEYFPKGENVMKSNKSIGLYVMALDLSGNTILTRKLSWEGDFKKFVPSGNGKKDDRGYTFFHKIVKTSDGGLIAVGEKYKKAISGLGVASQILGGGRSRTSAFSIFVDDMVVMQLDADYNLKEYKQIDKKPTEVNLPAGAGYANAALLASYIKGRNGFDYRFTTFDASKNQMFSSYIDFEKVKDEGKKAKSSVGTIIYSDAKFTTDKMPLFTEATELHVMPAKPGNILFMEYFKKKKMLTLRLEKVNY